MLKQCLSFSMVAASLFIATPTLAKNVTADLDQIAEVLHDHGYQAKLEGEGNDRSIKTGMAGYTFVILPFSCEDDGTDCKSVQFYTAFDPEKSPTLEEMNSYAAANRFGRIYLDHEGDPAIEMDIDLEAGGMSEALFMDNLAYWEAIMVSFAEFALADRDE
ncbi:YbjN domain-containing protein [Qipengyuania flava]|nr:YbjN domain-containing protein [Qipengyuania flava]